MTKKFWIPLDNDDLLGEPSNDGLLRADLTAVIDEVVKKPPKVKIDDLIGRVPREPAGREPQVPRRPCTRDTKRGRVLAGLLRHGSMARITKDIGLMRPAVLTYCFEIWRDHGIGYRVAGDRVTLKLHATQTEETIWK